MSSVMEIAMKEMGDLIAAAASPLSAIDALKADYAKEVAKVFNVLGYGADPLGVAGSATAIQAAIDAAKLSGGGIVFFPPGTYLIDKTLFIPSNVTLEGVSADTSLLKIKAQPTLSGATYGGSQKIITNDTPLTATNKNITLINLGFDGNGANQTFGTNIAFGSVTNLRIENCHFQNFGKTGIYNQGLVVFGGSQIFLSKNLFRYCSGDGAAVAEGTQQATIDNNQFIDNDDYGIAITNNCLDITVTGNLAVSNAENGIGVDECAGVTVIGNVCRSNGGRGIEFLRFSPNLAYPNEAYICVGNVCNGNLTGIQLTEVTKATVTGNQISGSTDKGIQIIGSRDCNISSNDIASCFAEGILLISYNAGAGNEVGDCLVMGNRIESCDHGLREISAGGTVLKSSFFGNRIENNANPAALTAASSFWHLMGPGAAAVAYKTNGIVDYDVSLKATAATAGSATALPATPDGYINISVAGVGKKIPYFSF